MANPQQPTVNYSRETPVTAFVLTLLLLDQQLAEDGMTGTELGHADVATEEARVFYACELLAVHGSNDETVATVHSQARPPSRLALVTIYNRCPRDQVNGTPAKFLSNELSGDPASAAAITDQQSIEATIIEPENQARGRQHRDPGIPGRRHREL